jgi:hypothetical protein
VQILAFMEFHSVIPANYSFVYVSWFGSRDDLMM